MSHYQVRSDQDIYHSSKHMVTSGFKKRQDGDDCDAKVEVLVVHNPKDIVLVGLHLSGTV